MQSMFKVLVTHDYKAMNAVIFPLDCSGVLRTEHSVSKNKTNNFTHRIQRMNMSRRARLCMGSEQTLDSSFRYFLLFYQLLIWV